MIQKVYHKIRSDEIHAEAIKDYHIATGEVHGSKIAVNTMPGDRILDASVDLTAKGIDGSLTAAKIKHQVISATVVPDVDTEFAHDLGVTPTLVLFTPKTTGVIGYLLETARSATSVTVRANVSGVDADIILIA